MNKRNAEINLLQPDLNPVRLDALYSHPDDVLGDAALPVRAKREILADWLSDRRAVEDAPAFRRLDTGAVVAVDDIMTALKTLDRDSRGPTLGAVDGPRRICLPRSLARLGRRDRDDDDDPPPAPIAAYPPRPPRDDPDAAEVAVPSLLVAA